MIPERWSQGDVLVISNMYFFGTRSISGSGERRGLIDKPKVIDSIDRRLMKWRGYP